MSGQARPVGVEVALRVAPEAARHADPRLADDQLADFAAHGLAVLVHHVGGHAGQRAGEAHGLSGVSTLPMRMPPEISVPPE